MLRPGATGPAEGSRGPTACGGEVAEPRPPHRDVLRLPGGTEERRGVTAAAEDDAAGRGGLAFSEATSLFFLHIIYIYINTHTCMPYSFGVRYLISSIQVRHKFPDNMESVRRL